MPAPTLFTTFLHLLGVRHTQTYSNREYKSYPPKLAFMAFQDLLFEYNVDRKVSVLEPTVASLKSLPKPCVLQMNDGKPQILSCIRDAEVTRISSQGKEQLPLDEFVKQWSGKALVAVPNPDSGEPDYGKHRFMHFATVAEHYIFWLLMAALVAFFFVSNALYTSWSLTLLVALYALGVAVSWMLTLKQYNVSSASTDAVCSMIEKHGCATVVNSDSGSFFGLFRWSEIGLAFFTVSLGALLVHPAIANYLAYISILCLPYSFWSVYTQHWKLHSWCTLCLCVQALFWIIFGVSLGGGHLHHLFPLHWDLAVLLAAYGVALLIYHKIVPAYFAYESRDGQS